MCENLGRADVQEVPGRGNWAWVLDLLFKIGLLILDQVLWVVNRPSGLGLWACSQCSMDIRIGLC